MWMIPKDYYKRKDYNLIYFDGSVYIHAMIKSKQLVQLSYHYNYDKVFINKDNFLNDEWIENVDNVMMDVLKKWVLKEKLIENRKDRILSIKDNKIKTIY